ncbi:collagen alpha-1(XXII) chain-like isoform X1 [Poecilia reticulata]|uniref:collagen alpha-1(XXII) chain-like isoform X1 n=1 Tax=Poecilia reticulata TaxID=8081 RepID=UPI0004A362C5|nr:PREDICTED: collagen alpha-1(XXII) chain-like isoform X1 [Poecilia reticulata]
MLTMLLLGWTALLSGLPHAASSLTSRFPVSRGSRWPARKCEVFILPPLPPPMFPPIKHKAELMVDMTEHVTGPTGEKGCRGLRGAKGKPGVTGPKGEPGPQGPLGKPGQKGEKGERGWRGLYGDIGTPGMIKGSKGHPGLRGDKGLKGHRGPTGEKGKRGIPGTAGEQGHPGQKGDRGLMGEVGTRGEPGARGKMLCAGLERFYWTGWGTGTPRCSRTAWFTWRAWSTWTSVHPARPAGRLRQQRTLSPLQLPTGSKFTETIGQRPDGVCRRRRERDEAAAGGERDGAADGQKISLHLHRFPVDERPGGPQTAL